MKSRILKFVMVCSLISSLFAQENAVRLDMDYFFNFETYYLLDFDFENSENNPDFFSYTLSGGPATIRISFELVANIPSVNGFNNRTIFSVVTRPFAFEGAVTLTSRDIDQNIDNIYYNTGEPVSGLSTEDWESISEDDLAKIQNVVIASGKLPAGTYIFTFKLMDENYGIIDSHIQGIEVSNPTFLDLVAPGWATLEEASSMEYNTLFPQFQWETTDVMWSMSNCIDCGYHIRICEYKVGDHSSPEEALDDNSNVPFPDNGGYFHIDPVEIASDQYTSDKTFQFPLSDAKPLEAGKYYAWQVKKVFPTTSGAETVESQIFMFKIKAEESSGSGEEAAGNQIMEMVEQILDPQMVDQLKNGNLNGYNPTGIITLNGAPLDNDQLTALINQFISGEYSVKNVVVE